MARSYFGECSICQKIADGMRFDLLKLYYLIINK